MVWLVVKIGFSATRMVSSDPSLTFPNHYTLVTGATPDEHGIVSNLFWDRDLNRRFVYTDVCKPTYVASTNKNSISPCAVETQFGGIKPSPYGKLCNVHTRILEYTPSKYCH